MPDTLKMRIIKRQRVELAEEMLSINALAGRWHCHKCTIEKLIKLHADTGGARGLLSIGSGRRRRIPARAANKYAASDDFLRT